MKSGIFAALALGASIGTASAAHVVDTGQPTGDGTGPAVVLASFQYLAGRFTTTEEFRITGLSAFVSNHSEPLEQEMTLSIASGPLDPMGATLTRLTSAEISVTLDYTGSKWVSGSIANYTLAAGTYWIIASIEPGQVSYGLGMPWGAPNPLEAPAFWGDSYLDQGNYIWRPDPEFHSLGFRVEGDLAQSVPEPTGLALMGLGFAVILVLRRRAALTLHPDSYPERAEPSAW